MAAEPLPQALVGNRARTGWMARGWCADPWEEHPEDWETGLPAADGVPAEPDPGDTAAAVRVCGGCPVRAVCALYAAREGITSGVWGGLLPAEVELLRRRESIPEPIRCGTVRGYWQGHRCPDCLLARAEDEARRRRARALAVVACPGETVAAWDDPAWDLPGDGAALFGRPAAPGGMVARIPVARTPARVHTEGPTVNLMPLSLFDAA